MKNIKLFKENFEIGGYNLPADFVYLDADFLSSLQSVDYDIRIKKVFELLTNKPCNDAFLNEVAGSDFLNVYSFDENFCLLDLAGLSNVSYNDYVFCKDNLLTKISSIISVVVASYVEIVVSELISINDNINVVLPCDDGLILLALVVAKRIGVPIDIVIAGTSKKCDYINKYIKISKINDNEIEDLISDYFLEYDVVFDPITAKGVLAFEEYFDDLDNDNLCLVISVSSPYLFSRKVNKAITGRVELDVDRAIQRIYQESSLNIPESIESGIISPYYLEEENIPLEIAIRFIKSIIKIWFLIISMLY